jgi:hypothetical protein
MTEKLEIDTNVAETTKEDATKNSEIILKLRSSKFEGVEELENFLSNVSDQQLSEALDGLVKRGANLDKIGPEYKFVQNKQIVHLVGFTEDEQKLIHSLVEDNKK